MDGTATLWFDEELASCSLADKRLDRRLRQLVGRMGGSIGASIPLACQDWANTKAAYPVLLERPRRGG
ncbi:transposase [Agrobacterium sp. NPDC089420]|uniref:IS4/Tn5 family transposase DNA-binding protein n=1 Tax=Agrobacterium sp. NPDC089420 TaxID=3363918 RepID=UPI00384DDA7D